MANKPLVLIPGTHNIRLFAYRIMIEVGIE